jgi:hypothetical protein
MADRVHKGSESSPLPKLLAEEVNSDPHELWPSTRKCIDRQALSKRDAEHVKGRKRIRMGWQCRPDARMQVHKESRIE